MIRWNIKPRQRMFRRILVIALVTLLISTSLAAQQIVAHRGHHSAEGAAENSIAALHAAHEAGIDIVEFDVAFTADGHVVVAHGPRHPQSGGELISKTELEILRSVGLDNGEQIPTLEEYLEAACQYPEIGLFLEIKIVGKESPDDVFKAVNEIVERHGLQDRVTYISFSKEICDLAREHGSMYLGGNIKPKSVAKRGYSGINYPEGVLRLKPRWIRRAHDLGLKVSIWTVNNRGGARWAIRHGVDYITTDNPALIQESLERYNNEDK